MSLADADIKANASGAGELAGWAVAPGGDINGDGRDDLLVGAPTDSTAGSLAGAVYILYGASSMGSTLDLGTVAARVTGQSANDLVGYSVGAAGDVDIDGAADFIVGGPGHDTSGTGAGAAWLVTGPVSGSVSLDAAQARLLGGAPGDDAGTTVIGVGDLDGDGSSDLLVGSPGESTAASAAGAAALLLGGGL